MAELTPEHRQEICQDYEEWSGGNPPDSEFEINSYVEYVLSADQDADAVRAWLLTQLGEWTD
jgi:hypothetical protein